MPRRDASRRLKKVARRPVSLHVARRYHYQSPDTLWEGVWREWRSRRSFVCVCTRSNKPRFIALRLKLLVPGSHGLLNRAGSLAPLLGNMRARDTRLYLSLLPVFPVFHAILHSFYGFCDG